MILEYQVTDNNYLTIKDALKNHFSISNRLLSKLKRNQKIFLNGSSSYVTTPIKPGDILTVKLDFEEISENILPIEMDLNIVYEDDSLLIINKPAGIPVHPSQSHFEDSLSNGVQHYYQTHHIHQKIRPVNRLDKDTSGIVIFAKNEYIQECLIHQMKTGTFQKEYLAVLDGIIEEQSGTIEAPIRRKDNSIIEREIAPNGVTSITHYELIKNFEMIKLHLSLVKFKLETGRTHQIRVHSKYIGHPIIGDSLYGSPSNLITRQALHAYKIQFIHPITKKEISLEIKLPNDMVNIIK